MIYAQHLRLYLCKIIIIYDYTCARLSTFVAKLHVLTTSMKVPAPMTVLVYTNLKTSMTIPVLYTQYEYITLLTVPVPDYQHTWIP